MALRLIDDLLTLLKQPMLESFSLKKKVSDTEPEICVRQSFISQAFRLAVVGVSYAT